MLHGDRAISQMRLVPLWSQLAKYRRAVMSVPSRQECTIRRALVGLESQTDALIIPPPDDPAIQRARGNLIVLPDLISSFN